MITRECRILMFLVMIIILSSFSIALGITPAKKIFTFDSPDDSPFVGSFSILNNDHSSFELVLSPRGELSSFLTLEQDSVSFTADDFSKNIKFTFNPPPNLEPGSHTTEITITEQPLGQVGVSTIASGIFKVILDVPYPGKYADISLETKKIDNQDQIEFYIIVDNKGKETIDEIVAYIEIIDDENNLLTTLKSSTSDLKPDIRKDMVSIWNTPTIGSFTAKANIYYDNIKKSIEKRFDIGELFIAINKISIPTFDLGKNIKISIDITNKGNRDIKDMYSQIIIFDNDRQIINSESSRESISKQSSKEISIILPTGSLQIKDYFGTLDTFYEDKSLSKDIILKVRKDKLSIIMDDKEFISLPKKKVTFNSVSEDSKDLFLNNTTILIIMIIIILLININILLWLFKRRPPKHADSRYLPSRHKTSFKPYLGKTRKTIQDLISKVSIIRELFKKSEKDKVFSQAIEFIKKQRLLGLTDIQIAKILTDMGFTESNVKDILSKSKEFESKASEKDLDYDKTIKDYDYTKPYIPGSKETTTGKLGYRQKVLQETREFIDKERHKGFDDIHIYETLLDMGFPDIELRKMLNIPEKYDYTKLKKDIEPEKKKTNKHEKPTRKIKRQTINTRKINTKKEKTKKKDKKTKITTKTGRKNQK